MPRCCAIKADGAQCTRSIFALDRAMQDDNPTLRELPTFCGTHRNSYDRHVQLRGGPVEGRCIAYHNGHWCTHEAANNELHVCQDHYNRAVLVPPAPPAPVVQRPQRWGLAAIANNAQSVHTAPVYKQMNEGLKKLYTIKVPDKFSSMFTVTRAWMTHIPQELKAFADYLKVINDVELWRGKEARYRLAFRALCYKIHTEPDKERQTEMWRRLFQECLEAVDMCCDGHLSRLANALVGFDDDFKPAISLGELIQQKLAAISEMDAADADKMRLATEFFDEHAVPDAERAPWLEALV